MLSIIPYIETPTVNIPGLGPTPPFGLLVVTGIIVGWKLILKQIEKRGIDLEWARDMMWWTIVAGFISAKLFDTIFYSGELSLRTGLSSTGGFIGGVIGFSLYFRKHPQYKHLRLTLVDACVTGFVVAWIFGRMGCFVVHDHVGIQTDFFLGIDFPESRSRAAGTYHDLGFYEMLFAVFLSALLYTINRKERPVGTYVGLVAVLYGPVRIGLDFLRPESTDARYIGLTPAQWGMIALTLYGVWVLARAFTGKTKIEEGAPKPAANEAASEETKKPQSKSSGGKKKKKKRKR